MDSLNEQQDMLILQLFESHARQQALEKEKLGIPDNGYFYHKISEQQDRSDEFIKTEEFLKWIVKSNPDEFDEVVNISFINYGDTELVYVIDESGYKRTLLVGQPNIEFGTVKKRI